jgi:hypothetical protein
VRSGWPSTLVAAATLSMACTGEATEPRTTPGGLLWVEWPTGVSAAQPGTMLVSGAPECPQYTMFDVSDSGSQLQVTATVDFSRGCTSRKDTVLSLPPLATPSSGLPARFTISGPVIDFTNAGPFATNERLLGQVELRTTPDTATLFAGIVFIYRDSLACWRAIPSRSSRPTWTFAKSLPLGPESSGRAAFLRGRLVPVAPPICGDTVAIDVFALEIDATPHATVRSLKQ